MAVNDSLAAVPGYPRMQRRMFMLVQAAKALVGGVLGLGFFSMIGRPDTLELVAMAGLVMPGVLALLGFTRIKLPVLEQIGLAGFAFPPHLFQHHIGEA